jgi:hypothetical protein
MDSELLNFYNSKDFINLEFSTFEINHQLSGITIMEDDLDNIKYTILNVVLEDNGKIMGVIHAISMLQFTKNKVLPNNNNYAMLYKDFSKFDFDRREGVLTINDLNYDNSEILKVEIGNEEFKRVERKRIDKKVLHKYGYISDQTLAMKFPPSCYGGDNGNVSWGECYSCLRTVCAQDVQNNGCLESLILTNYAGTLAGFGPIGDVGIAAACVVISATY